MASADATGQPTVITTACRCLRTACVAMDSLRLFGARETTHAQPAADAAARPALGRADLRTVRLAPAVPRP